VQRNRKRQRLFALYPLWWYRFKIKLMNKPGEAIRRSLLKRQEALSKFKAMNEAFFMTKREILKEIEEAKTIWEHTIEQLPNNKLH
jgi:hypothetical protein